MLPSYDVFLSHNRRQKAWVRQLAAFLRQRGLAVFFDEDSIRPGDDVIRALESAVLASRCLVLILSRGSVFSQFVTFETTIQIYEDPTGTAKRLVPVMVEAVDKTLIRPAIRRLDFVDLTDPRTREVELLHFLKSLGINEEINCDQLPPWPESSGIEELCVADLRNVTNWGWSGEQLLEKLIELDYQLFENITIEQEGHVTQWAPVFVDHPDTWRLLTTPANEIIGYWHFVPLFPDEFSAAMRGELKDSEITTDRVCVFELPGRYSVYFVSFGLLPRYRKTKAYKLLLHSLFDVMEELAREGIFIDQVCANAFSPSGEAMCKTFGLTYLAPHLDRGKIFAGDFRRMLEQDLCKTQYGTLCAMYSDRSRIVS